MIISEIYESTLAITQPTNTHLQPQFRHELHLYVCGPTFSLTLATNHQPIIRCYSRDRQVGVRSADLEKARGGHAVPSSTRSLVVSRTRAWGGHRS